MALPERPLLPPADLRHAVAVSRQRTLARTGSPAQFGLPQALTGSYFPGFLEPRRMAEKALTAVIHEACIISPRRAIMSSVLRFLRFQVGVSNLTPPETADDHCLR